MHSYFIVPVPFIFAGFNGKVNSDLVSYFGRVLNRTIETANGKAHLAVITFAGFHDVLSLLPVFTIPVDGSSTKILPSASHFIYSVFKL